jgi:hypothetical protein
LGNDLIIPKQNRHWIWIGIINCLLQLLESLELL